MHKETKDFGIQCNLPVFANTSLHEDIDNNDDDDDYENIDKDYQPSCDEDCQSEIIR